MMIGTATAAAAVPTKAHGVKKKPNRGARASNGVSWGLDGARLFYVADRLAVFMFPRAGGECKAGSQMPNQAAVRGSCGRRMPAGKSVSRLYVGSASLHCEDIPEPHGRATRPRI